jgi:phage terminase small subunit
VKPLAPKPNRHYDNSMNPKQKSFADEYLVDKNATQAAIRAGYSKNSATQLGYKLLMNVDILAYLKEKTQSIAERLGITTETTLRGIQQIAGLTIPKIHEPNPAVSLRAYETLGKHLNLWDDSDKKAQNLTINIIQF